jgi:hypothetical protein
MFVQGKKPALVVPAEDVERLHMALRRAGYHPHTGHRYQRRGEVHAWAADLSGGRHIHVQEVAWNGGRALFAHTEPASGLAHVFSAVTDGANFAAGSRKLRADLRAQGWRR